MTLLHGKIRLSEITFVNGVLDATIVVTDDASPSPPQPPTHTLPTHYDTDEAVGWDMLQQTVATHHLDAVAVQNHGPVICDALNQDWPGLNSYAHKISDAVMWPGFGSLDVTINSGLGGWYFRVDGKSAYGQGR